MITEGLLIFIGLAMLYKASSKPDGQVTSTIKRQTMQEYIQDFVLLGGDPFITTKARLETRGPVFYTHFFGITMLSMTGRKALDFVVEGERNGKIHTFFPPSAVKLMGENSIVVQNGLPHKRLRSIMAVAAKPAYVSSVIGVMEDIARYYCAKLLAPTAGQDHISVEANMVEFCQRLTGAQAFHLILGVKDYESAQFQHDLEDFYQIFKVWKSGLFSFPINLPGFAFYTSLKKRAVLIEKLKTFARKQMAAYEASGKDEKRKTFLIALSESQDDDGSKFTLDELAEQVLILFFAGFDTTSVMLISMIEMFSSYRIIREKAIQEQQSIFASRDSKSTQDDLSKMLYLDACIKEMMRLRPVVPNVFKKAVEDLAFEGKSIPKGTVLFPSLIGSVMYVGTAKDAPIDSFTPERWIGKDLFNLDPADTEHFGFSSYHAPFGIGKHACIGKYFAMNELKTVLSVMLRTMEWRKEPERLQVKFQFLPFPMPVGEKLPMRVNARSSSV